MLYWPSNPPRIGSDIGYVHERNGRRWTWTGYAWNSNGDRLFQPHTSIVFRHSSISPTDNQEYYFGDITDQLPFTSISDAAKIICLFDGDIIGYSVLIYPGLTLGTSEPSNYSIYNETKDLTVFESNLSTNSIETFEFNLENPIPVSKGDRLYAKWNTPTWEINPTNLRSRIEIKIKLTNV